MHELESVQVARQNYNAAEQRKRMSRTSKYKLGEQGIKTL